MPRCDSAVVRRHARADGPAPAEVVPCSRSSPERSVELSHVTVDSRHCHQAEREQRFRGRVRDGAGCLGQQGAAFLSLTVLNEIDRIEDGQGLVALTHLAGNRVQQLPDRPGRLEKGELRPGIGSGLRRQRPVLCSDGVPDALGDRSASDTPRRHDAMELPDFVGSFAGELGLKERPEEGVIPVRAGLSSVPMEEEIPPRELSQDGPCIRSAGEVGGELRSEPVGERRPQ